GGFGPAPKRRLSIVRSLAALGIAAGAVAAGSLIVRESQAASEPASAAWYAPYVDVTLTPSFAFEDAAVNPSDDVVLSFVVADSDDACAPTWGAAYGLDEAADVLDLDRRIALYRQQGGDVVVSFG